MARVSFALLAAAALGCASSVPSVGAPAPAPKSDFVLEEPEGPPRASILLIHGSAPFDLDGRIPKADLDSPYARQTFYRDLSLDLRSRGLRVLRYSKPGVGPDGIDGAAYAQTDLAALREQLIQLWRALPANQPRLVFAWSEGTLHVRALPLDQVDGVILLGAISTNIADVVAWQGGPSRDELRKQLVGAPRDTMLGLDRPAGRLVDELDLAENWSVFAPFKRLPILVLHGTADQEVPVQQAAIWSQKLPEHHLQVVLGDGLDHRFMPTGKYELGPLAEKIGAWLDTEIPRR